ECGVAGCLGVVDVVRTLAAVNCHSAGRIDPAAAWVALPRRLVRVLGGAERVLGRLSVGGGIAEARLGAGDVEHGETHGATDRSVGAVAWAEAPDSIMEAPLP